MPETADTPARATAKGKAPRQWDWPSRFVKGWDWRSKLRWFAAEIVVVVVGVLIAIALNAWWQGRQDADDEARYLRQLSQDLSQIEDALLDLRSFEDAQIQVGIRAYRLLSTGVRTPEQRRQVSDGVTSLTARKTLLLSQATYTDLLSTGNLRLITNQELRTQILSFYEKVGRLFEIHNLNNTNHINDQFGALLVEEGLFYPSGLALNLPTRARIDSAYVADLGSGYIEEPDYFWRLSEDSPEWARLKSALAFRIRFSHIGQAFADSALKDVLAMKEAVDTERAALGAL